MARVLHKLHVGGLLSFGPEAEAIELRDLNVLIGPNGSGKSNFVEVLALLRATPTDLSVPVREGGGVREWLWKLPDEKEATTATVQAILEASPAPLVHQLDVQRFGEQASVFSELVGTGNAPDAKPVYFVSVKAVGEIMSRDVWTSELELDRRQSILAQRKDPDAYPELFHIASTYSRIQIYRNWRFGPKAPMRDTCAADEPSERLSEALDNLPARLAALQKKVKVKARLNEFVRTIAEGFTDLTIAPEGGRLQLRLTEGEISVTARRLSDGTLRMLCLAAILMDPEPGSILVIEEPELGLHPDLMPTLRDLLVEASVRAQVIVTTHSTVLADAFTERLEDVLIFQRSPTGTRVSRVDAEQVGDLRAQGGLGAAWMAGAIGGTRW